jgi:hypothetical protein
LYHLRAGWAQEAPTTLAPCATDGPLLLLRLHWLSLFRHLLTKCTWLAATLLLLLQSLLLPALQRLLAECYWLLIVVLLLLMPVFCRCMLLPLLLPDTAMQPLLLLFLVPRSAQPRI